MPTPETTPELSLDVQTAEDGQEETIDWEKRYKDVQAELTRKAQELAKYKETQPQEDDPEYVKSYLKNLGVVTKEDLEQQKRLDAIFSNNPELSKFEEFIRDASKQQNIAPEDVIVKYGLASSDKLTKAKSKTLPGNNSLDDKPKGINELSKEEREQFESEYANKGKYSKQDEF